MPVINPNSNNGNGGSGANTHAVPSNYAQNLASQIAQMNARQSQQVSTSPSAAPTAPTQASTAPAVSTPSGYTAAQLAQMYNAANAESINPQNVHYGVGSTGNLQVNAPPSATAPNSGSSITISPAATGLNQLPGWIQSQLQSGKISSWTNPNTGQTFYGPNTIGNGNTIWVNGPSGSGPITSAINGQMVQITHSTGNIPLSQAPASATASGSGIPLVDYQTFGTTAKLSFPDPHNGAFTLTISLSNGDTFTYSGSVGGVPLGTILAQDQAVDQAWSAYQAAQQNLQNVPAGASITVTQGTNGLNLDINAAPGTSLPTQTTTIAPGFTITEPTPTATFEAASALLSSAFMNGINPSKTYTSDGITFTGSQLQNMYESYESQINTALTQENPQVTVSGTTANFNSLTTAEQQQYVQQQTDQYLQNMQYNGAGYYSINGKNVYISNPAYYATLLGNGTIGEYEGTTAPLAPVSTPTFTTATPTPTIELPQGWSVNPTTGDLTIQGNPNNGAPTLQQAEQYANAYSQYLTWYQANNPAPSSTNAETSPPPVPNWYDTLTTAPTGAVTAANLAALQYAPLAPTITAPQTLLQGIESWVGQNIVNPVENAGKDIENFWNYYPVANGPGQAFGSYSFNTPVQNLKFNFSTKQEWVETNVPGVYINPATHQYWNSNNYEVGGFQPMNSLPPNVATPSSLFNQYVAKPFEQYVASPVEQAASYAASQIYPELPAASTVPLSGEPSLAQSYPVLNLLKLPSIAESYLSSSISPYINTGAQDINNFLSSAQKGVNQWATTPYNPGNILSAPYWQNQVGTDIQLIEQLVGHPLKTIGAIPGQMAHVQTLANELVEKGYAPWYLPDVTMAMMAAPLVASGVGGAGLASAATGGTVASGLLGAGINTAIGAGANYGIGGLLQGQWTGPQAVQNAETGGLTAAMMAPLAVGSPIADWLASKGITGLSAQILNNIPVFGSWSALNAGLSSEAQGSVPTPAYLGENFGEGAALGAAIPIGGRLLSSVAAKFLPNAVGYGIDDYISKFGSSPQVADYIKSVTDLGGDPNDLTFYANKATGNIAGVMYDGMHVSYDTAQQIGQYLQQVADQNGGKVILAHTSPTSLPNSFDIQSAEETGSPLGGVRANAYRAGEGMYYNLPTEGNQPLWLSGYLGGENYAEPRFSLNPFANLKGTLLATTTTPSNIDAESLNRFFAENPGTDLSTSQGQNLLSRWLYEQAMAQGKQFGIPYQNYLPGGGEQQVMGYPGTNINMLNSQTYAFRPNEGFFAPVKFIKVGMASNLPEDMVAGAGSSAEPLTQEEYANLARESAATSSGAYYYTPYGAIPASIASAIASRLPYAQGLSLPSPSTYSAPTSALSTPYSVSPMPSISPSAASSPYSLSPSAAMSSSPSIAQSSFPSVSSSTYPSISSSTSPSVASSPYSSVASTSPSMSYSPSSVASSPYFYPGSIRKPLELPFIGSQWFAPQRVMAENPYEAYASIYSPSLLPEVMPELESLAEQEYSPMTALSTIRPLRAPSVNTPITLPSYATPTQPTIAEENLPGASNYYQAQSTPMAHVISGPSPTATPSYSFNEPFSNAPAATQVSPIMDPALLQAVSTAANPLSLGTLPANAPPSPFGAIANPMLQSLNGLDMNKLTLPSLPNPLNTSTLPNPLNTPANLLSSRAMSATSPNAAQPSGAAFGSAGYMAPRIGNISLIPTAQDIMSVLGPEQMLRLLNQINPTKFSVTNIQYAPRSALAAALNNLSYSDIVLLMSEMSIPQRMMVYGLLGIPPGEALIIAESGTQELFIPSLSNALAATTRKRIVQPISSPSVPQPARMPIININPPTPNVNRQLVTV